MYSELRDSHNSLIEVATQISSIKVCWVLYKSILLYNMFIGLFQSSLDISGGRIMVDVFFKTKVD